MSGWQRYVALGDSTTEGLEDPYPDGRGYRGWADRLAERLAGEAPGLRYANLAVRGKLARQVREEQLAPALALKPDLASVLAGLNDTLRRGCDVDAVAGHLDAMAGALTGAGATVLLFTFPDPVPINPLARTAAGRLFALNAALREIAARHGARLADLERHPVASDPRLWHPDRLHANPDGHARIAAAAAQALGLPGASDAWTHPLPAAAAARRHAALAGDAVWLGRHVAPWVLRRLRGRSSGDGRVAKRPSLDPVRAA
ncbi:MAG TPA: SGNH/GDSL hydrolase family protein [Solirubrobacteraceae bacterium]